MVLGDRPRGAVEDARDTLTGDRPAPGTPSGETPQGILPGQIAWSGDGRFVLTPDQPSEARPFTLTNTGFGRSSPFAAPEVRGLGVGVFEIMASDCPDTFGSGEACQVMLRASVTGSGTWAARLETDGAPGGVPLAAEAAGFAPAFAWSGDGLFALDGAAATPATAERILTLSNIGTLRGEAGLGRLPRLRDRRPRRHPRHDQADLHADQRRHACRNAGDHDGLRLRRGLRLRPGLHRLRHVRRRRRDLSGHRPRDLHQQRRRRGRNARRSGHAGAGRIRVGIRCRMDLRRNPERPLRRRVPRDDQHADLHAAQHRNPCRRLAGAQPRRSRRRPLLHHRRQLRSDGHRAQRNLHRRRRLHRKHEPDRPGRDPGSRDRQQEPERRRKRLCRSPHLGLRRTSQQRPWLPDWRLQVRNRQPDPFLHTGVSCTTANATCGRQVGNCNLMMPALRDMMRCQ